MMPTPWVPHAVAWIKATKADAGLHLTLTSEWKSYRWGPLAGKPAVPGLVDPEGALWPNVASVVKHATADEVEREIRAQLDRARTMGFEPTHFDSHMGTLFASDAFKERYIKVGIEQKIPVMFPGGHNFYTSQSAPARTVGAREIGQRIWAGGLPVLDDIHNFSYGWKTEDKVDLYIDAVRGLKPGVTMMIMHCTASHRGLRADFHVRHDPPRRPQGDDRSAPPQGARGRAHRAHHVARADGTAEGRPGVQQKLSR